MFRQFFGMQLNTLVKFVIQGGDLRYHADCSEHHLIHDLRFSVSKFAFFFIISCQLSTSPSQSGLFPSDRQSQCRWHIVEFGMCRLNLFAVI